jgi:hypothetical protein
LKSKFLLLLILILCNQKVIAQVETNLPIEREDIIINGNESFCLSSDVLTVTNKSTQLLKKISWDVEIWEDNKCVTCQGSSEYHYELILLPSETISGQCFEQNYTGLSYFIRFNDPETKILNTTTKVILLNISIENVH